MPNRSPHQPLGASFADRLDPNAGIQRDLLFAMLRRSWNQLFVQQLDQFLANFAALLPLNTQIDIFGVFAIDN